ncbi:MAG: guanine-specific ribonuclease N1 and T1 [Pseudonocardia sp.]|nr:guanine-specific ribonuclease N1 and T1 [Pseudonocardia sp.]
MRAALVALAVLAAIVLVGTFARSGPAPQAPASGECATASAQVPGAAASKLPVQPLCALPTEAAAVYAQIRTGGPYRYERDGVVFANAERLLPAEPRGYYHEFTVPTPGEGDRGARRLVTGSEQELYYTGDHYGSFVVVDVAATAR